MDGPESVLRAANRLVDGGVELIEIAATTPQWMTALESAKKRHPNVIFGVGTIRTIDDAEAALRAGAEFLVCPHLSPPIREAVGGFLIEGGFTPNEIAQAGSNGLAKLFPSHAVGPEYLRSLLAVLPEIPIMPTGGLTIEGALEWLRAGATAVGVGSSLAEHPEPGQAISEIRKRSEDL
jgi:2-dehydro-3-deoxyphosphogluconate aldolase/(4S)-4-hydroxy-2-oxoglutarate aldolase